MPNTKARTSTGRRTGRCRSWRPVEDTPHSPTHPAGQCRACWRPCFRPTYEGQARCGECLDLLMKHPAAAIRIALASEPDLPVNELRLLATDADEFVAMAARWSLERRLPHAQTATTIAEVAPPDRAAGVEGTDGDWWDWSHDAQDPEPAKGSA